MILNPICWIVGFGWQNISGIEQKQSNFPLSYLQLNLDDSGEYEIKRISDLPGDFNDYFC